jgi:deazaflavin-dependent oxidoreductase (nitroreductase family)
VFRTDPYDDWEEELARGWISAMNGINLVVYEASDGQVAGSIPSGLPLLLLTTVGSRTGRARTVTIVYLDGTVIGDPGAYYVVGSNGGLSRHPAWVTNVRCNPAVRVAIGTNRFDGLAAEVTDPDAAALIWSELARGYAPFREYGTRAQACPDPRQIRVIRIERLPDRAPTDQDARVSM